MAPTGPDAVPAELTGGALMLTGVVLIRADDTRRSALT
jgi:hypothetical protein